MLSSEAEGGKALKRRGVVGVLALGVIFAGAAAAAAEPSVEVVVTPPEIALTTGGSGSVSVVISNPSATPAADLTIEAVSPDASVEVRPTSASTTSIPAGASRDTTFTVKRVAEGVGQPISVRFVVRFTQVSGTSPAAPRVVVASLKVTPAVSPALITAKFEGAIAAISENRPGETALVIGNPRETPVDLAGLQVTAPTSVGLNVMCPANGRRLPASPERTTRLECPMTVQGRSELILAVQVEAPGAVVPGQRSVVFRIDASAEGKTESVTAALPLNVEVFAEADVLKSIGVPVFLLLPGVLVVVTTSLLVGYLTPWGGPRGPAAGSAASWASAVAVISLAASLVIAKAYPWLTEHFFPGQKRDYLVAYGFVDFYFVIAYSFLIAGALWLMAWVAYALKSFGRSWFVPAAGDDPSTLLRKLALSGSAERLVVSAQGVRGLAFGRIGGELGGQTLVVPRIMVTLPQDSSLRRTLDDHLKAKDALGLWWTIRGAGQQADIGTVPDDVAGPILVANVTRGPKAQIVQLASRT